VDVPETWLEMKEKRGNEMNEKREKE